MVTALGLGSVGGSVMTSLLALLHTIRHGGADALTMGILQLIAQPET